jgi:hypothetical protein
MQNDDDDYDDYGYDYDDDEIHRRWNSSTSTAAAAANPAPPAPGRIYPTNGIRYPGAYRAHGCVARADESAARPITSQFQQQIQNINSQASRAGRFGSAAQGQLQSGAAESLAANLSGLGERLGFAGYQQERQLQEAALNRQQQAQQQALINQLAATSGLGQTQAQQFATQLQAAQGLTGAEQGAANVRLTAAQLAPALASQDFADIQRLCSRYCS